MVALSPLAIELTEVETRIDTLNVLLGEGMRVCDDRSHIMTNTGFVGLAPAAAKLGDVVAVLLGAPVSHVLRPVESGREENQFALIGESYVYGVMDGEAIAHIHEPGHRSRPFQRGRSSSPLETFRII